MQAFCMQSHKQQNGFLSRLTYITTPKMTKSVLHGNVSITITNQPFGNSLYMFIPTIYGDDGLWDGLLLLYHVIYVIPTLHWRYTFYTCYTPKFMIVIPMLSLHFFPTLWPLRCPGRRAPPSGTAEKLRTSASLPAASSASIMAIPCGEARPVR